jgi:voltage-gated potassium channel
MALLGLVYLACYSAEVVFPDNLQLVSYLEIVSQIIWLIFLLDLIMRFFAVKRFGRFLRKNWLEMVSLMLLFVRFLRVFRAVLALTAIKRFSSNRASATGLYVLMLMPLTWFTGAVAVLDAESASPGGSITNLREALWWSLATITTVGYGDKYPITLEGQLIAAVLMIAGISLFSAGAAMFATWMLAGPKSAETVEEK